MTDGDVADDPAVVGGNGATVFDDIGAAVEVEVGGGGGLEAFDAVFADIGDAAVVGDRRVAEDDEAAPAAGGGEGGCFGNEAILIQIRLGQDFELVAGGHDDRLFGGAGGVDLGTAGDDDGAEGVIVEAGCALVVEG